MRSSVKAAARAVLIIASLSFASAAEARERHVSATWTTHRGTFTGHADVVRTRGFRSRDAVVTGPNGGQRTVSDRRAWSMQNGTYSHDRHVTFADGTSRTVDADARRVAPGTWDYSRSVTRRDGQIGTINGTVIIDKGP